MIWLWIAMAVVYFICTPPMFILNHQFKKVKGRDSWLMIPFCGVITLMGYILINHFPVSEFLALLP